MKTEIKGGSIKNIEELESDLRSLRNVVRTSLRIIAQKDSSEDDEDE